MTDLHTHILPGIDDGASDIKESFSLLQSELKDGVDTIALTPHYKTHKDHLDKFLQKREQAYTHLVEAAEDIPVKLLLGAEMTYSSDLPSHDLEPLCIGSTKALLIELPSTYPSSTQEVLYSLTKKGYMPIIAHIDRYPYIISNPDILDDLLLCGALIQVNAESLLSGGKTRKRILELIDRKRVHIIATDTHSMKRRPPMLGRAMELIRKKLGDEVAESLNNVPGIRNE